MAKTTVQCPRCSSPIVVGPGESVYGEPLGKDEFGCVQCKWAYGNGLFFECAPCSVLDAMEVGPKLFSQHFIERPFGAAW